MNRGRFDQLTRGLATKRLSRRQLLNILRSTFSGRRGNNGAALLLQLEGHQTLVKLVVRPLARHLNFIGLLLFALVTSLVSVAVLAKGRLLGFDGSDIKTIEELVAAASSLGTAPVLASDPHVRRLGAPPDALLPPYRGRVVGDE